MIASHFITVQCLLSAIYLAKCLLLSPVHMSTLGLTYVQTGIVIEGKGGCGGIHIQNTLSDYAVFTHYLWLHNKSLHKIHTLPRKAHGSLWRRTLSPSARATTTLSTGELLGPDTYRDYHNYNAHTSRKHAFLAGYWLKVLHHLLNNYRNVVPCQWPV